MRHTVTNGGEKKPARKFSKAREATTEVTTSPPKPRPRRAPPAGFTDVNGASKRLGLHPQTVRSVLKRSGLQCVLLGSRVLIPDSTITKLLEGRAL